MNPELWFLMSSELLEQALTTAARNGEDAVDGLMFELWANAVHMVDGEDAPDGAELMCWTAYPETD
ncbi:hypothetical protein [Blastococcus mobilis]|uniref:Uncharacterized protein n=1 Tax=Blastococcus mobilis TaxID=1938746 RepID=A0A238VX91_9ACTN|nr:hypothetical protein [Blastococcus mobilis]SNR38955.1 hypothetical protein SAMN06272737_105139 [Blastococcus mobilis]